MNLNKFISIASKDTESLFVSLYKYLSKRYEVYRSISNDYMFMQGNSSVCLVAHLDTVFKTPPKSIYRSRFNKNIISSPQGLGADDRAGVYAIIALVDMGLRPSIIFTTGEESGGTGALELVTDMEKCPLRTSCLIELDREGKDDSVYYRCGNADFEEFINGFGFKTAEGIFSDISILAPAWNIAAVNLSIGYKKQHSYKEYLNLTHLDLTIEKVSDIIKSEPEFYDYCESNSMEFWSGCFNCTTSNCPDCERLNDFIRGRNTQRWQQKALL